MDDFDMGLLDDKTYMVSVLRQKMLGIAPVFMYRIKQEKPDGQDYKYVGADVTMISPFHPTYLNVLLTFWFLFAKCR
jgi:hypothetical protein